MEKSHEHIKIILYGLLTCAKQEIPLRGHLENINDNAAGGGDDKEEKNGSNNNIDSWDISLPPHSQKLPSRLEGSVVTASLGKSTRAKTDHDLRAILSQIIDCQLNELSAGFSSDAYGLMKSAATLLAPASSSDSSMST